MARIIGRPMAVLVLSDEERSYLERQVRRRRVARSISDRCRMILRCADGLTNKAVAAELGVHEHTVGKWRRRFLKERIEGLSDEPRPGRPRTLTDEQVAEVIERTLETTPADATHWSIRSMARESGLSHTTIRRIWAAFSVQPHRSETFKLSSVLRLLPDGFDSVDELYADDRLGQPAVSVEAAPTVLCRLGEFEDHGERRLVGEASLGSHGTVSHGGECAFDRVGGAQMLPVLGGRVVEGLCIVARSLSTKCGSPCRI